MNFDFSFETTAGASQSSHKPALKPNTIHEVQFDGVEQAEFNAKDGSGKVYKVLKIKFSNDTGAFEHTLWAPTAQDAERTVRTVDGKDGPIEITDPSRWETSRLLIKHLIDAVNPAYGAKIDNKEVNFGGKDWDELCKNVGIVCNPKAGQTITTKIKLLENKEGQPIFPGFFVGLRRADNAAYIRNNFIGNALDFTSYEATRIKNSITAKPTEMPDIPTIDEDTLADDNLVEDFDVLGL